MDLETQINTSFELSRSLEGESRDISEHLIRFIVNACPDFLKGQVFKYYIRFLNEYLQRGKTQ